MAVNKVEYAKQTLIDLTSDTVTPEQLISGVTAHNAAGVKVTGTFDTDKYLEKTGDASNTTVAFTASTTETKIASGDKLSILFGKLLKFINGSKTITFSTTEPTTVADGEIVMVYEE